jgi:hypothetical protein
MCSHLFVHWESVFAKELAYPVFLLGEWLILKGMHMA